ARSALRQHVALHQNHDAAGPHRIGGRAPRRAGWWMAAPVWCPGSRRPCRFLSGPDVVSTDMKLDDATRDLLDGPHTAILATANADGCPQSTVIFVKRDGDTVVFSTIKGRLKSRNMVRDPRGSLLVLASAGPYVVIRRTVDIQ